MPIKLKHIDYNNEFILRLKNTEDRFIKSELKLLRQDGQWLNALMRGQTPPITQADVHFIKVCKGEAEPNDEREHVWMKYLSVLKDEKELERLRLEDAQKSPKYKLHASRISAP